MKRFRCLRSGLLALLSLLLYTVPLAAAELGTEAQREEGRELYVKYCSQCHGENGDGVGYATERVVPRPRDFTSGKYKFRTTPSGKLPLDADLSRVIRLGLPYTSMPGWQDFTDAQVQDLIYHLKSFSADFENPDMHGQPITIGEPVPATEESIERGRVLYGEQGCAACHGVQGRGNGASAPTLTDDWGHHIRPADLTQRWTFRGGPTKTDIFRTFSTGLNGTPMPSYADGLAEEDRWHLVNYIYSLGESDDPRYASLLIAPFVEDELDLARGVELFQNAPRARFPLIGQVIQLERNFYPSTTSVEVQAIYNRKDVAFLLRWHDLRSETSGHNAPDVDVPAWELDNPTAAGAPGAEGSGDDDFFGGLEETEAGDDFFAEEAEPAAGPASEWNDAVAIQLPVTLPTGNRKPYFIFGDSGAPVDLWFLDLARQAIDQYTARGSDSIERNDADDFETQATYDDGEWRVVIKRPLRSAAGITLSEGQYVPIVFSIWDGFNRERGNKRALSAWFYFYTEPSQKATAAVPMIRTALLVLLVELAAIVLIRRRNALQRAAARGPELPHREMAT